MIASVSFVLTKNLICNFPQTGQISNFPLINMHEQTSNSQKNSKECNHISSSIMVLLIKNKTVRKLVKIARSQITFNKYIIFYIYNKKNILFKK